MLGDLGRGFSERVPSVRTQVGGCDELRNHGDGVVWDRGGKLLLHGPFVPVSLVCLASFNPGSDVVDEGVSFERGQ